MEIGILQRLVETLGQALEQLSVSVSPPLLEGLAITIDRAMSSQARSFHTPEHIFSLVDPDEPIHCLAAPFHDIVYYQVDRGFTPEIGEILTPYIQEHNGELAIVTQVDPADRALALTMGVFGFAPGYKLALSGGLNEFMSALVMNKKLMGIVPEPILLQTTACIEATIPFRGKNEQGKSPFDLLAERLAAINASHRLGMPPAEIHAAVKSAVAFANKDVSDFASADPAIYLAGTWRLLPETNIALRSGAVYSIRDYRQALQKTERFLWALDPANVFHTYGGVPAPHEFERLNERAQANINVAREYLGIKLLTIAILEALAEISGGDVPLSLFMGDIERGNKRTRRIEDALPPIKAHPSVDMFSAVYRLLETGRAGESSFDIKNAPLSLFIYKSLGPTGVRQRLSDAQAMFDGRLHARQFLDKIDGVTIAAIARASAAMAVTRRDLLNEYARTRA